MKVKKLLWVLISQLALINLAYAADVPEFTCAIGDAVSGDTVTAEKTEFNKDTDTIYLYCNSDEVTKGQNIKGVWIAADTNNVAPANYKVAEKSLTISQDISSGQTFTAKFDLSKPNNGWPTGKYHVDLYVDDQLQQSVAFTIK